MYKYIILVSTILIISSCSSKNSELNIGQNNVGNNTNTQSNIMLQYINEARAQGAKCAPPAPPLYWSSNLESAALVHSKDMAANNFLQHTGSGTYWDVAKKENGVGSTFIERIEYFGYKIKPNLLVGENIARTSHKRTKSNRFTPNFKSVIQNWLEDTAHCEILMNPRFKYVGGGSKKTSSHTYFTLDFAEDSRSNL